MRDDIKNLLDQVGQPNFQYREFEKARDAGPVNHWPLLVAVASHPALARGLPERRQAPREPQNAVTSNIFRRVDPGSADPAPQTSGKGQDIQSLLRRLSEQQG